MTIPEEFFEKLRQSLVDSGVHTYRAWKVAQFVTQCYDVLLSAHHALVQSARWEKFCATRGATTKRKQATAAPANISETAITADLSREAQRLLEEGSSADFLVSGIGIACVIADCTTPSDTATGSSSKRPDLVFFPADPALQLKFAMEAKIIRKASGITNDLLGAEGFGCFVRVIDPYETNDVVGLLGYVEPTETLAMVNETERSMRKDSRFTQVSAHALVVNAHGPNHQPPTVVGSIVNAEPKVCIVNMLAVKLTTLYSPE